MSDAKAAITPQQIIEIVLRRRWLIIVPFCLAMIGGIYLSITMPRIYEASTLILVQPQKVPTGFVQSIVTTDISDRLNTISQQILSRTNLERIIEQFKMFEGPQYEGMYMEDKVGSVKSRVTVDVPRSRRREGPNSFSISFRGTDPETVMQVVNTLASYFIDENLRVREAQATGTSNFLDGELETMRKRLEEVEESVKHYRKKYMGELPEQLESNLRILDRMQEHLEGRRESLRDARGRLADLNNTGVIQTQDAPGGSVTNLDQLKEHLARMLTTYTERHPDVVRLKNTIADLEAELEKEAALTPGSSDRTSGRASPFAVRKRELTREIRILKEEIAAIVAQINMYSRRVENTPKREQEFLSLQRDYQNIQNSYSSLLNRKLEAEIAVNMERKQKGEQFRVIDPARLPQIPVQPDVKKMFLFTIAAGLGLGGGIIFLLEFSDKSFRSVDDIESFLELPVLAAVPTIELPEKLKRKRMNTVCSIISLVVAFVLLAGFAVLTLKGVDQTIAFAGKILNL